MIPEIIIERADVLDVAASAFEGVHVLLVDPPYSEYVHANMVSADAGCRGYVERDPGFEACTPALRSKIAEIARTVLRWSVVFSDHESTAVWRSFMGAKPLEYIRLVPWVRWSQPQKSGDRPGSQSEAVLHFHPKGAKRWTGPGWLMAYGLDEDGGRIRRCLRGDDKHPTEKPLDLMLDQVSWFSDPGDTVADVCAGAGTTALACRLLGRDCISLERDAKWIELARKRVALKWAQRDHDRAVEWCVTTQEEGERQLAKPRTKDANGRFNDEGTRARAQRRIADAGRVAAWL